MEREGKQKISGKKKNMQREEMSSEKLREVRKVGERKDRVEVAVSMHPNSA